jgi:hypothetical protein
VKAYQGGCHCGGIQLTYWTATDPSNWPLRDDGCSFCRKHGVVATSDPSGEVEFAIADPHRVRRYRFATCSADFLVCGDCGVFVAAVTETPVGMRAVINARALAGVSLDWTRIAFTSLDGESLEQRQARRARNWTPVKG